jgi:hypothetical protein
VQQPWVAADQPTDGVDVVAPDRGDHLTRLHEARPARRLVAARKDELRVGQLGAPGVDRVGVVTLELRDRRRITLADRAEQVLRLVLELLEVGTDRQVTGRHDEPP